MVTIKLYKIDGEVYFYKYYQDGKEIGNYVGEISINKITGEKKLLKEATEFISTKYLFRAYKILDGFFENKDFKETGIIAWG